MVFKMYNMVWVELLAMKNATSEPALLHFFGQVSCLEEIKKISSSVSLDQGSLWKGVFKENFKYQEKNVFHIYILLLHLYIIFLDFSVKNERSQ